MPTVAPLSFLRGKKPSRISAWAQNPCIMPDSQDRTFQIEYYNSTPDQPWSFKQIFPARAKDQPHRPSRFTPPPHYHLLQDEYFKIESGKGIWHLAGGKTIRLQKGDEIVVPMWKWHWLETAPDSNEPLSVLYRYDREYSVMEERFFRNQLVYMTDCRKAGVEQSLFQVMVFCIHNWMPLGIVSFGPEWFKFMASTVLMVVLRLIGEFLLGYQASYPEYYAEHEALE